MAEALGMDATVKSSPQRRRDAEGRRGMVVGWVGFVGCATSFCCARGQLAQFAADFISPLAGAQTSATFSHPTIQPRAIVLGLLCGPLCLSVSAVKGFARAGVLTLLLSLPPLHAEVLVDPTRSAMPRAVSLDQSAPASEGSPQVGVAMVVTAKEGVMALLDGRILRVGSRTEQGEVVKIVPEAVFVRAVDGKVTRLSLYPEVSKQAVTKPPAAVKATGPRSDRRVPK